LSAVADKQKNATKAAAKVRAAQQQKRQRMQWSIGIIVLVVAGVVVLVLAKMSQPESKASSSTKVVDAPASIATNLAKVPLSTIVSAHTERVKSDSQFHDLAPVTQKALTKDGKPEVLYMGAEYCPYCGGERWALTVALSKFGSFSGLKMTHSSEGSIPTLSFLTAKYTSKYLTFTPIELEDQDRKPLEKANAAQMKLLTDAGGSYPYINFGGKYVQSGASLNVDALVGNSQTDIAKTVTKSGDVSSISGQVNSAAGAFVKAICTLTEGQPGDVYKAFSAA
jgi:thiol-disulfide isomerase/thioredoxin